MSAHTRMPHTHDNHPIFCISEQGELYKLPESILKKYIIKDDSTVNKARKIAQQILSVSPEEVFAEINEKYTQRGALLKAIRLREGLNQKDFAVLIDVTQGDLSKMENGKRSIGKALIIRIAKKFKSRIR
jgi:DNA-binding transcriptional regulator YiaG